MKAGKHLAWLAVLLLLGGCVIRSGSRSGSFTFSGLLRSGVREVKVPLNTPKLQQGANRVYYPTGSAALARLANDGFAVDLAGVPSAPSALNVRPGLPAHAADVRRAGFVKSVEGTPARQVECFVASFEHGAAPGPSGSAGQARRKPSFACRRWRDAG